MNKQRHSIHNFPSRLLSVPAVLMVGLVAAPAVSASAAETAPLTCGTVVTSDVRLTADLLDCPGSGLVVGASGITIDLAGHVIDGTGSGAGIDNVAGHDDLRVANGTVQEFLFGIELFETSGARIEHVTASSNANGMAIHRSDHVALDSVTANDNWSWGMELTFNEHVSVRGSTAAGNELGGIVDRYSYDTKYVRNTTTGNQSPGLTVDRSHGVVVERNYVAGNNSFGIDVSYVEDAVIARNVVVANAADGITIEGPGTVVRHNEVFDNGGVGILAAEGTIDGGRNQASGNLGGDCIGVVCR